MKKKLIASLLLIAVAVSLFTGCAKTPKADPKVKAALDGKKIIFVGSSSTYYGGTVARTADTNLDPVLANRVNDQGYFYQLCRAHGAEVNVVDWTFGGHDLGALLGSEPCTTRKPCEGTTPEGHLAFLTDRYYDYVIIQGGQHGSTIEDSIEYFKKYTAVFKAENPNVKIYCAVPHILYVNHRENFHIKFLSALEKEADVTILDWGTLVWDVMTGKTEVPGAKEKYNQNSFIVSRDHTDGYHPNPLTGYLFALMTFSAITGVDAVGQPYDFCYKEESGVYPISLWLALDYFKETYYRYDNKETPDVNERQTNFIEIFNSEADMKGLQSLVNTYLADETNAWEKHITE
ncbi:MAG: hypothetical protein IJN74_04630 [Clostridia bacterium]|nr:hypothetical protein [Clostridia bacterium]